MLSVPVSAQADVASGAPIERLLSRSAVHRNEGDSTFKGAAVASGFDCKYT